MQKSKLLLLLSLLTFAACKQETPTEPEPVEEPEQCVLEGSFVRISDSLTLSYVDTDSLLIEELSFFEEYCTFTYDSIGYRGSYGCLDMYVWVSVEGFDTLRLERISDEEMYGQGFIQGKYLLKGSKLLEAALAESSAPEHESKLSKETSPTPEKANVKPVVEKVETTVKPDKVTPPKDPVVNSTGLKAAKVSFGDNLSGNTYRVRLYEPYAGGIKSSQDAKIYFMLTVDAQGNVMKAELNAAKTNTTNTQLINDITALVKKIKYNKEANANLAKVPLMVTVNVD